MTQRPTGFENCIDAEFLKFQRQSLSCGAAFDIDSTVGHSLGEVGYQADQVVYGMYRIAELTLEHFDSGFFVPDLPRSEDILDCCWLDFPALQCARKHMVQGPPGCWGGRHLERGAQEARKAPATPECLPPSTIKKSGRNLGHRDAAIGEMQNEEDGKHGSHFNYCNKPSQLLPTLSQKLPKHSLLPRQ